MRSKSRLYSGGGRTMQTKNTALPIGLILCVLLVAGIAGCNSASGTTTRQAVQLSLAVGCPASQPNCTAAPNSQLAFTAFSISGPTNGGVTWSVSCPSTSCGTISPSNTAFGVSTIYTVPASIPPAGLNVTVAATSVANPSASASVPVSIVGITVSVTSTAATIEAAGTQQFTATVVNDPSNQGVNWSCPVTQCGSISPTDSASGSSVTYTAPATPPSSDLTVTVTASSAAYASATASATVTVPARVNEFETSGHGI